MFKTKTTMTEKWEPAELPRSSTLSNFHILLGAAHTTRSSDCSGDVLLICGSFLIQTALHPRFHFDHKVEKRSDASLLSMINSITLICPYDCLH